MQKQQQQQNYLLTYSSSPLLTDRTAAAASMLQTISDQSGVSNLLSNTPRPFLLLRQHFDYIDTKLRKRVIKVNKEHFLCH